MPVRVERREDPVLAASLTNGFRQKTDYASGAIDDDWYGRCWVRRDGCARMILRANRYALATPLDGAAFGGVGADAARL
jgi:hypothetical protein